MKTIWILICTLCLALVIAHYGCDVPYNEFGPGDLDRLLETQGEDTICLRDGFDTACIRTVQGPQGESGTTLIAIREVPVEVIVEKIVETIVVNTEVVEIPVIVERIVEVIREVEVPIEDFVEETVDIIREVPEVEIIEVPVVEIVEVIKTVYRQAPAQTATDGATYTDANYTNLPNGWHRHTITHTHDGATHTHRLAHPNGEPDNWDRLHDGYSGLTHD